MQCMQLVQGSDNFLYFELHGQEVPNWKYNPSNRMLYARVEQKKRDRYWERYHPLEFSMQLCEAPDAIDNVGRLQVLKSHTRGARHLHASKLDALVAANTANTRDIGSTLYVGNGDI